MASKVASCTRCRASSVIHLRYCGQHLCGVHFVEFVDRRVQKEVRKQGGIPADARIAVALSGGKDSTVALHLVHGLVAQRPDVELLAVTVDEGIEGYRPHGLEVAAATTRTLGVEHVITSVKDYAGFTMDEVKHAQPVRGQCSYCGVFRRRLMNEAARRLDADLLVTGHNLDDVAQSVLMNLSQGELDRLARLGPHTEAKPGLIPRRMPLRMIPEREVYLYAMQRALAWHDEECPYAAGAQRGVFRDILARMEDAKPGTRHALLRTFDQLQPLLSGLDATVPLGTCGRCGEASSQNVCQACRLLEEAQGLIQQARSPQA
jgi:uncharacterized protein (TIGR00269 family)